MIKKNNIFYFSFLIITISFPYFLVFFLLNLVKNFPKFFIINFFINLKFFSLKIFKFIFRYILSPLARLFYIDRLFNFLWTLVFKNKVSSTIISVFSLKSTLYLITGLGFAKAYFWIKSYLFIRLLYLIKLLTFSNNFYRVIEWNFLSICFCWFYFYFSSCYYC